MKFYEIGVGTDFTVDDNPTVYTKVKEERISCCKVKVNAIQKDNSENQVFKPMTEVKVVNS